MPLLRFAEEGLDPHRAFAHGLLVAGGLVIGVDPLQIRGVERAVNRPTAVTGGTRGLHWAGIAGGGVGPIDDQLFGVLGRPAWEPLPFGALILVPLAIIGELRRTIEGGAVPVG